MTTSPARRMAVPFLPSWLCLGLLTVLSLIFITPPFQAPDEAQHFFRAYQISEGKMLGDVAHGTSGGSLPSSLSRLVEHFLGTTAIHADVRPVGPRPLGATFAQLRMPLEPERREYTVFSGAAYYAPLAYLPQAGAIGVGRLLGAGPLALLYMARLANGLAALALIAWGLRLLPVGRELAAFAALLPMAVFLYASVSTDAIVISSAFLFTALVLNRIVADRWSAADSALALACALAFCLLKPTYVPLLLLGFAQVLFTQARTRAVLRHAAILCATLLATVLWMRYSAAAVVTVKAGTGMAAQLAYVIQHPVHYLVAVLHSLYWRAFYYREFVGVLGWLTVPLPLPAYLLPIPAVLLALGSEAHALSKRVVLLLAHGAVVLGGCVLLVMTALYLYWTPIGFPTVEGVQGRYFLPLLALGASLLAWTLGRKALWSKDVAGAGILVLVFLEAVLTIGTVAARYSVF
ncbi:DUF2142 domain-containing protein [uncultured Massilia sp.]|uniref:DUF2142 domain-containing protein n=1 Tax=uncultured Massilia sp. TaxID=169973 RepID=UPI0025D09067|nr:DUF2142 domain-containing protein [uncultured Massilia sp.]